MSNRWINGCCYKSIVLLYIALLLIIIAMGVMLNFFIPYQSILEIGYLDVVIFIGLIFGVTLLLILSRFLEHSFKFKKCSWPGALFMFASMIYFASIFPFALSLADPRECHIYSFNMTELEKFETSLECKGWDHDHNSKNYCTASAKCCVDIINDLGGKHYVVAFSFSMIAFCFVTITIFNFCGNYSICNCCEEYCECCGPNQISCCCDGVKYFYCCDDKCCCCPDDAYSDPTPNEVVNVNNSNETGKEVYIIYKQTLVP